MAEVMAEQQPISAVSCSICRDCLDETSAAVAIACGHVFHERCVGEWLKQSPTCPQCRQRLRDPKKEMTRRIYLSFAAPGDNDSTPDAAAGEDGEPAGLAELRLRLAAAKEESEEARKRLKRLEKRDAQQRRDLGQRQRQITAYSMQLETFQESLTQQAEENSQLMQLLAQAHEDQSELQKLRAKIDEERLAGKQLSERLRLLEDQNSRQVRELLHLRGSNADLRTRQEASQLEVETLSERLEAERDANTGLTDELLAREAELFDLSKRLNSGHEYNSRLATRLSQSELRVAQLAERLLRLQGPRGGDDVCSGASLAALSDLAFVSLPVALPGHESVEPATQSTEGLRRLNDKLD